MKPRDPYDRNIMDIIPERYDGDGDAHYGRPTSRLKSWLMIGVAVAAVGGVVAAGLHFMGAKRGLGTGIPVIKADERPIKIRPDDRGGMQVPNQDKLIYGRLDQGDADAKTERLLPPPETPQVPPKAPPEAAAPRPSPVPEVVPAQSARSQVAAPAPAVDPVLPAPVLPSQLQQQPPVPVASASVAAPAPVLAKPALPSPPPMPAPVLTAPPKPAPPPPPPPPPAPAPVAAKAAPVLGGDWLIQLGALRSAPDAEKEWGKIQRANADLLAALRPDIVRVELGDKGTYWRVRGGPLSEMAAKQLCVELKNRNQGCIVARR